MKVLREIKNWQEWLDRWEENETQEIAISLLHLIPRVPYFQDSRLGLEIDEFYKRIDFCLEVADADRYPAEGFVREVGQKAYQVLVRSLLPGLVKSETFRYPTSDSNGVLEIPVWKKIIKFFAYRENSHLDKEPYKSEGQKFVVLLEISLKKDSSISAPFGFVSETKMALSYEKATLASALVNVGAFDHIINERIFEAILALRQKIVHWCWEYDPGKGKMEKMFPQGKEKWENELENLKSKTLRFALERVCPVELVQTFMTLLVLSGEV